MYRLTFTFSLLLLTAKLFAQSHRDSLVNNMPMVNGRLVYADTVKVPGHSQKQLDTTAKKWFAGYFKFQRPDTARRKDSTTTNGKDSAATKLKDSTVSKVKELKGDNDATGDLSRQAVLEFRMTTTSVALVKYKFYLVMSIKIHCIDNGYTYKIDDIFFVPESKVFRAVGYYDTSPEYLIGLYQKKHMGLEPSIDLGRKKVVEYLNNVDTGVRGAIASLQQVMMK
jgi:hypothetical protein